MTNPHDHRLASYERLCQPARRLALFSDQTIGKISDQTSTEQIQAARYVLTALYETLARRLDFTHYVGLSGQIDHTCLRDVFVDADAKLKMLLELHPAPAPRQPDAPQSRLTPEQVYELFDAFLAEDLFFGEERESG
jgi:uncharacterized protein (DUF2267 family)